MPLMRFRACQHLRKQADFKRPPEQGRHFDCGGFLLRVLPGPAGEGTPPLRRMGVIASRKVGNAVVRNRAKRVCRELFRLHQDQLPAHCDVLMIVRQRFSKYDFATLQRRFLEACRNCPPCLEK